MYKTIGKMEESTVRHKGLRAAVIAYYTGTVAGTVRAMKRDGINVTAPTVARILKDPRVDKAIGLNAATDGRTAVALYRREDLQKFWQDVLDDPTARWADKLKASELLGKSLAAFTEKVEHSGQVSLGIAALLDADLRTHKVEGEKAQ